MQVIEGDGSVGWAPASPCDAIVASAEGLRIPPSLRPKLRPGGRLVMPVEDKTYGEMLVRMVRDDDGQDMVESIQSVRFIPLIGTEGWPNQESWLAKARRAPGRDFNPESYR